AGCPSILLGVFFGAAAPALAMRFFGLALHVGVPAAEQQASGGADPRANQPKIGRSIEQAGIPLHPARQQLLHLLAQRQSHRSDRNSRKDEPESTPYGAAAAMQARTRPRSAQKKIRILGTAADAGLAHVNAEMQVRRRGDC